MDFIREQRKEKPISKRKLIKKLCVAAMCAIVFTVVLCLGLSLYAPVLKEQLLTGLREELEQEMGSGESETQEDSIPEREEPSSEFPGDWVPEFSLSLEDYQKIQAQLYEVGEAICKSLVSITTSSGEDEWLNVTTETKPQGSGVIIHEDGNYYYILTEKNILLNDNRIRVTFDDESAADATLLKYDGNTGVAILAVEKRQVNEETTENIAVIQIGNSYGTKRGTLVIALGNLLGEGVSIHTGNVISINNEVMTLDKNYDVLMTDIMVKKDASGILVNAKGELIGMVMSTFSASEELNALTAVSISEIRGIIERLVEGKDVPYIGLYVSTITKEISTTYGLPMGVFVKEVKTDSPAMFGGLQSGDIITKINGEDIYNDATYSTKIHMLLPSTTCEIAVQRQNGNEYMEVKCEVQLGVLQ